MSRHQAVLVTTATAGNGRTNGASLRVDDVQAVLADAGYDVTRVQVAELRRLRGSWCLGVAVSYVNSPALRRLRSVCARTWLDAVDSWLLLNGEGLRAGRWSYALRAARDAVRLSLMPAPDLVTWISAADRAHDKATVRGHERLVLPGSGPSGMELEPAPCPGERRVVLAGDWCYPPNRDGLAWFAQQVLPRLPGGVEVYGTGLPAGLPPRLHARGYAERASSLYRVGDVHVAPVLYGAGVKRKVLQPLLMGLPVVTTTAGAHGLRPHELLDVRVNARGFAAAVATRLSTEPQRTRRPALVELVDRDDTPAAHEWLSRCPLPHGD